MFLLDDILLMPARGFVSLCRKVHDAAQEEFEHEAAAIRTGLSELYILLETGQLSQEEFDRREEELLDRLEQIQARSETEEDEEADQDEEADMDEDTRPGDV